MRCCSWAASWLSSGVDTIGNFHPLHYVILSDTFAQHETLPLTSTLNKSPGDPSFPSHSTLHNSPGAPPFPSHSNLNKSPGDPPFPITPILRRSPGNPPFPSHQL